MESNLNTLKTIAKLCDKYRNQAQFTSTLEEVKPQPVGSKRERIVSISDLHLPFFREDLIKQIVQKTSGAEYCVINGDILDSYALSSFHKSADIPFSVEYAAATALIDFLATQYGQVILVGGNHDVGRWGRELDNLNVSMKFLLGGCPLAYIAEGIRFSPEGERLQNLAMPNVTFSKNIFWARVGQTIFAHRLRGFNKGPLANAITVANFFMDRGTEFQCLVSAHSHRGGMMPYKGKIIIDQGCLCLPLQYETDGRCTLPPQDLGYAIVTMDKTGNVDPEETKFIYLGTYRER